MRLRPGCEIRSRARVNTCTTRRPVTCIRGQIKSARGLRSGVRMMTAQGQRSGLSLGGLCWEALGFGDLPLSLFANCNSRWTSIAMGVGSALSPYQKSWRTHGTARILSTSRRLETRSRNGQSLSLMELLYRSCAGRGAFLRRAVTNDYGTASSPIPPHLVTEIRLSWTR